MSTIKVLEEANSIAEKIAIFKGRTVTVRTNKRVGEYVSAEIVRTHDGIFLAEEC